MWWPQVGRPRHQGAVRERPWASLVRGSLWVSALFFGRALDVAFMKKPCIVPLCVQVLERTLAGVVAKPELTLQVVGGVPTRA